MEGGEERTEAVCRKGMCEGNEKIGEMGRREEPRSTKGSKGGFLRQPKVFLISSAQISIQSHIS